MMEVKDAIKERRAYRALERVDITDDMVAELVNAARLAPSCFNKQPWRFVFVRDRETLARMHDVLSQGNEWARKASMMVAVVSKAELDCVIRDRKYYLFDTGLAVGQMLLRATEMGLVAHPIAGFSPRKAREALGIPGDMEVVTLVIVGKHSADTGGLAPHQAEAEMERPERKPLEEIAFMDKYISPDGMGDEEEE